MRMETKDQKFFIKDGQLKAMIDVDFTHEDASAPSIRECRHAVLQLNTEGHGYVVYDRLLCRIVNGVYHPVDLDSVLAVAQNYNENDRAPQDMAPNGLALGLIYPVARESEKTA